MKKCKKITCHPELNTEALLTHHVLDRYGVDARVAALGGRDQELRPPVGVADGHTFGYRNAIFQPLYLWPRGCLSTTA